MVSPGRQLLAYAMQYSADSAMAMILPVPVPMGAGEDLVRFIDLSGYVSFFEDLDRCFDRLTVVAGNARQKSLRVHDVGDFEASFVPTLADFARLDPRFRLNDEVEAALPMYADLGFVVVQLRGLAPKEDAARLHPIAFEFPTRYPNALFYPTLHVHDGTVPDHAGFDHTFYAQHPQQRAFTTWQPWPEGFRRAFLRRWECTSHADFDTQKAQGLLSTNEFLFRIKLEGSWPNVDLWVPLD